MSSTPFLDRSLPMPPARRRRRGATSWLMAPTAVVWFLLTNGPARFDDLLAVAGPREPDQAPIAGLLVLWGLPVATYVAAAIHEAGHLLAGLAVRYRFVGWHVGRVSVLATPAGLRVRANVERSSRTIMLPRPDVPPSRAARVVFLSGGIAANLATAVALVRAGVPHDGLGALAFVLGWLVGYVSLIMTIANAVPVRATRLPSDGAQIADTIAANARYVRTLALATIARALARGTDLATLDAGLLDRALAPGDASIDAMRAHRIAYAAFAESDAERAAGHLDAALARTTDALPSERLDLVVEAAMCAGWVRGDAAAFATWAEEARTGALSEAARMRLAIAELWVRGDRAGAERLLDETLERVEPAAPGAAAARVAMLRWRLQMVEAPGR